MKTYLDSGVLIMAFRAEAVASLRAMQILDDANREFVTSPFVKLETLPKAQYQQQQEEVAFYETYFKAVRIWVEDMAQILPVAHEVASKAKMNESHCFIVVSHCQREVVAIEEWLAQDTLIPRADRACAVGEEGGVVIEPKL
jgi:hypothetical protein